jgi:hypothetical protein
MKHPDDDTKETIQVMVDLLTNDGASELPDDLDYSTCELCGRTFRGPSHKCKGSSLEQTSERNNRPESTELIL